MVHCVRLNTMAISIMTFSIMTQKITKLSIMTFSIMALLKKALSLTMPTTRYNKECFSQDHNNVIMPSVILSTVVAPMLTDKKRFLFDY
jgi:hypothetical protein